MGECTWQDPVSTDTGRPLIRSQRERTRSFCTRTTTSTSSIPKKKPKNRLESCSIGSPKFRSSSEIVRKSKNSTPRTRKTRRRNSFSTALNLAESRNRRSLSHISSPLAGDVKMAASGHFPPDSVPTATQFIFFSKSCSICALAHREQTTAGSRF